MSKLPVSLAAVAAVAAIATASLPVTASADTLEMEGTRQASFEDAGKPRRGMTQDRVRSAYGEPRSRESAVGDPPISRWHYEGFIVYFEYDKVIHAVSR